MMVICIELKIPLFLVGKPGSSKSLAKSVVKEIMGGRGSKASFYRQFREIQMVTFQCSPLTTAKGIEKTFSLCENVQKVKGKEDGQSQGNTFAAVAVLDEIGLAEDSQQMPLKVLHHLLELLTVSFVGISNWALDPAKMNRGILLNRMEPTQDDLMESVRGICRATEGIANFNVMEEAVERVAKGYLVLRAEQKEEYYGLRDLYAAVKMLNARVKEKGSAQPPGLEDVKFAVKRNFGGGFQG